MVKEFKKKTEAERRGENGERGREDRQIEGDHGPTEHLAEGLSQISEFYFLFYFYEIF